MAGRVAAGSPGSAGCWGCSMTEAEDRGRRGQKALQRAVHMARLCEELEPSGSPAEKRQQRQDARDGRHEALASLLESADTLAGLAELDAGTLASGLAELTSLRGCSGYGADIRRAMKAAARQARGLRLAGPAEARPGLDLGREDLGHLRCPAGYEVLGGCIRQLRDSGEEIESVVVVPGLMLPTATLCTLDGDAVSLLLEWRYLGRWRSAVVPRAVAMTARELVALAGRGAPVSSATARGTVAWLAAVERENRGTLPQGWVSSRMGWCGPAGAYGFMWGGTLLRAEQVATDGPAARWPADSVTLAADAGQQQLAEGYQARGTWQGWVDAVSVLREHPRALAAVYASLAAPLLGVIPAAPNFIVDWSGKSSHGKTTALRVAASCWGLPSERDGGCIQTWDSTAVGGERAAEMHHCLPLLLDDTKRARKPEQVDGMLYRIYSGKGRLRGSPDGMRRTAAWRTILLSTGEVPATSFAKSQGARARVLSLRGLPFGDGQQGNVVETLVGQLLDNHGHAGPRLVCWLYRHRDQWPQLRERYGRYIEEEAPAGCCAFLRRAAPYLALLRLAAELAEYELGLPLSWRDVATELAAAAAASADAADLGAQAVAACWGWAVAHETSWMGRHVRDPRDGEARVPAGGWAGRWDDGEGWLQLCWLPQVLRSVLGGLGYDVEAVLDDWAHRGWLLRDEGKRTRVVRLGSSRARCVCLRRAAIESIEGSQAGGEG